MINIFNFATNLINFCILFIYTFLALLGVPGDTIWIILSGAFANNLIGLLPVIIIGSMAAILGDLTAYELAYRFSPVLSKRLNRFKFFRDGENKARRLFRKFEFSLIFFTRFIFIGLGAVVSYMSGFEKIDRKKFLAAIVSGEIIYTLIYAIMGFLFKETWNDLVSVIGDVLIIAALILIVVFLAVVNWREKRFNTK